MIFPERKRIHGVDTSIHATIKRAEEQHEKLRRNSKASYLHLLITLCKMKGNGAEHSALHKIINMRASGERLPRRSFWSYKPDRRHKRNG